MAHDAPSFQRNAAGKDFPQRFFVVYATVIISKMQIIMLKHYVKELKLFIQKYVIKQIHHMHVHRNILQEEL